MSLKRFVYLFIAVMSLGLSACSRPEGESSQVQISIPQLMKSSKVGSQALSASDTLIHVTINVTGEGLPGPIVQNWDSCGDCPNATTLPSSFMLTIPTGTRMIQVLAVYKNSTTNSMNFYYGDVTQSLSGSSVTLTVPLTSVGGGSIISGNVGGRYLTGTNTGLTGIIDIKYQASATKPALIVDSSFMTDGWFNFFMLSGASFSYIHRDTQTVLWGGPVSLDHTLFDPAGDMNQRVKAFVPVHTKSRWENGATTYSTGEPRISVWGYWGPSATGKQVCLAGVGSSTTDITRYASADLSSATALTINHVTTAGTATPTAADLLNTTSHLTSIMVKGGAVLSASCGAYSDTPANNYVNFLKIRQKTIENDGHDEGPGFKGIFITDETSNAFSMSGNPRAISGTVLPGMSTLFDEVVLYARTGSEDFRLDYPNCREIATGVMGFSLAGSGAISASGDFTISTTITPETILAGATGVICPSKNDSLAPVGQFIEKWTFQNGYYVQMDLIDNATYSTNTCFASEIQLKSYNGSSMSGSGSIPVSTTVSGANLFATQADCLLGSPTTTSVTLASSDRAQFYFRTPSTDETGAISLGNFTISPSYAVDGTTIDMTVSSSTSGAVGMSLSVVGENITSGTKTFSTSCTPMKISLTDAYGNYVGVSSAQSLDATITDDPGTSQTNTGALYGDSACSTENLGVAVSWDATVGSKIVYVFGSTSIDNSVSVNLGGLSALFEMIFN